MKEEIYLRLSDAEHIPTNKNELTMTELKVYLLLDLAGSDGLTKEEISMGIWDDDMATVNALIAIGGIREKLGKNSILLVRGEGSSRYINSRARINECFKLDDN